MRDSHILVVDDQDEVRDVIAAILRADGHQVETASHVAEALSLLTERPIDLIVSDLRMPALDGPSFYLELTRRWPDTRPRMLFLSGFADRAEYATFLGEAKVPVLLKPIQLPDLQLTVRRLLVGDG